MLLSILLFLDYDSYIYHIGYVYIQYLVAPYYHHILRKFTRSLSGRGMTNRKGHITKTGSRASVSVFYFLFTTLIRLSYRLVVRPAQVNETIIWKRNNKVRLSILIFSHYDSFIYLIGYLYIQYQVAPHYHYFCTQQ